MDIVDKFNLDLIVIDYILPDTTSSEVCRNIRYYENGKDNLTDKSGIQNPET